MPPGIAQEVVNAAFGAYRLARFDPSGLDWFDLSVRGFWRSFLAAVAVALPYALVVFLRGGPGADAGHWVPELVIYVLGWTVFPVVMVPVSWALSLSSAYVRYIIAYNWSAVVQVALILPVALIDATPGIPDSVVSVVQILVTAFLFTYQWFIARVALSAAVVTAVIVVLVDFLLGLVITLAAHRLLQA